MSFLSPETSPAALLTFRIDAAGVVTDCDADTARALGGAPEELVGRPLSERVRGDWAAPGAARRRSEVTAHDRRYSAEVLVSAELAGARTVLVHELEPDELGEAHRAFLSTLTERLRHESSPAVLIAECASMLGRHLGVNRVGYAEIDTDADTMTVEGDWTDGSLESAVGVYPFEGSLGPVAAGAYRRGETLVFENVPRDPRVGMVDMAVLERMRIVSAVTLGLVKNDRLVGLLSAHNHHVRSWTSQDVRLVQEVAERMWAAIERARAEARRKDSEEQFRTFAENLPDLCWVSDASGHAFWHNRQHERYFGSGGDRLSIEGAVAPEDQERVAAAWTDALARGEALELEVRLVCIDGLVRPFRTKATPVRDEDGRVVRWCGVATDISAQKQAEAVQAFLLAHAERLRPETSPGAVLYESCEMLGRHLGVGRVGYAEIDDEAGEIVIAHDWCADPLKPIGGRYRLVSSYASTASYRTGETQTSRDLQAGVEEDELAALAAMSIRGSITVPLVKDGRLVGIFSVAQPEPRDWTPAEVRLVEEVAERTWATLERARAEAARRETESQFRSLAENLPNLCWISASDGRVLWSNQRYRDFYAWRMRDEGRIGSSVSVHPEDREASLNAWARAYATGKPLSHVVRSCDQEGVYRPFYVQAQPVKDAEGRVVRWCGILTDLSDQQSREARQAFLLELGEALRRETDPLAILAAASERLGVFMGVDRVGYGELDADTGEVVIAKDWCAPDLHSAVGRFPKPTGDSWVIAGYARGVTLACRDVQTLENTSENFRALYRFMGTRGMITAPLVKAGRLSGLFSVHARDARDWSAEQITLVEEVGERTWEALVRARAEQAWRDSEQQFRSLAENLPDQCWVMDAQGELTWSNQKFRDWHAGHERALAGDGSEVVHPDDWPAVSQLWADAMASGQSVDTPYRALGPDGAYHPFFSKAQPIRDAEGRVVRWFGVSTDLTEQRATERRQQLLLELGDALRQSGDAGELMRAAAERLARFLAVDLVGFAELGGDGETLQIEQEAAEGALAPLRGELRLDAFGASPRMARLAQGEPVVVGDVRRELQDDPMLPGCLAIGVEATLSMPILSEGRLVAVLYVNHGAPRAWSDGEVKLVCEAAERTWSAVQRARADAARRESEALLTSIMDHAPVGIYVKDLAGRYVLVNPEMSKLLGRPVDELIGLTARDVVDVDYADEVEAHDRWVMETGATHVSERKLGYGQTGSYDWSLITRFPVTTSEGAPRQVAGINVNLSAQKAAESELERSREQLYQSEKLTALGSLLAGVSHELNNPLSIVVAQAVMMERQAGESPLAERAKQIRAAADRCARIVQTFLAMARQRKPERRRVNLNEVVDAALELTAYGLRTSGVRVIREQTLAIPPISADADQLHQVIINLVINAQQAMAEQAEARELSVRTGLSPDLGSVVLEIADNGPGVPEELRRRIFEPFFTTKPQDVGTGVGLSFSQGLVESHDGRLELLDTPRGAAFRMSLPVSVTEDPIIAPPTILPAAGAASRTALVVDDEPAIARALAEFLAFEGFCCDTAFGGGDAKARLLTGTYDLIVSDLRMPDIDGPALFAWIKAERPDLAKRVAFATGDTLGAPAVRFLAREGRPFMEKPFTPESLRRLLDDLEEYA